MPSRLANLGMLLVFSIICSQLPTPMPTCSAQDQLPVEPAPAAFRVETDVFIGTRTEPAQQSLTLFSGGVAYDISFDDPNQITMVDVARERIVLLNKQTRTQANIDLRELQQYIESARKQAETSPLAAYLRGADQIERANNGVQVGDSVLRYEATLQTPREEQMAVQYARVADALSLLNGWRSGVPPFARLSLNREVAEQKSLPAKITRTASGNNQSEVVHCRLHANWRLSKDDEKLVSEVGTMLVSFQTVSPPEFFAALK